LQPEKVAGKDSETFVVDEEHAAVAAAVERNKLAVGFGARSFGAAEGAAAAAGVVVVAAAAGIVAAAGIAAAGEGVEQDYWNAEEGAVRTSAHPAGRAVSDVDDWAKVAVAAA
jgi:hypothetical protein